MDEEGSVKQEASLPVQSRVDVRTLANLVMFWEDSEVRVSSMSQLMSWTVELALDVLRKNDKLLRTVETVAEAHRFLVSSGLYQPGLMKRGQKKIAHAIGFENMRYEGVDPEKYAKTQFNILHNVSSVKTPEISEKVKQVEPTSEAAKMTAEVMRRMKEMDREETEKAKSRDKEVIEGWEKDEEGVVVRGRGREQLSEEEVEKRALEQVERKMEVQKEAARVRAKGKGGEVRVLTDGERGELYEKRVEEEVKQLKELKEGSEEGPVGSRVVKE